MALADAYVLAPDRSARAAALLLEKTGSAWEPCWDPSDPHEVLGAPDKIGPAELFEFLERHPELEYTAYLSSKISRPYPQFAILSFCHDGTLIAGLSGEESCGQKLLDLLFQIYGVRGYHTVEEAPRASRREFEERAALSSTVSQRNQSSSP